MRTSRWIILVLVFVIFTTIVQIAGVVTPLWIYLETNSSLVGVGLYYRIGCEAGNGNNCTDPMLSNLPFGYNKSSTYDNDSWTGIIAMETISACFGVFLCIMMMVYMIGFGVWKGMTNLNTAMVVISIFAWVPILVGLIVYIIFYGLAITRSPDISSRSFPWSALMCLFAAIFFFIITFLIRFRCGSRNYLKNAIPTSTDSKMALNPSTKNQLMKRYFTPSPYREDRRQALYSSIYSDQTRLIGNGFAHGAVESSGFENRGLENRVSRAIEYNNANDIREQTPVTRVVETKNLSSGTFVGNGAANTFGVDNFQGTVYEQNLGSYVQQNVAENRGAEVIKKTYITTITGDTSYGNGVTRAEVTNYRPEVREDRQKYIQQQWEASRGHEALGRSGREFVSREEKVIGTQTTLAREREHDAFSELEAETVFYTGKEGFEPIGLSRRTTNIQDVRSNHINGGVSNGYVVTQEIRQSTQPIQKEEIIEEVTVIERDTGKAARQNKVFRIPADHNLTAGTQKSTDYTVHTRTFTENQASDELLLAPGYLSGKPQYNGTYVYRPYSETSY